jgi:RNA polymerase sigma-70 factor (ECF subfamily)
MIRADTWKEWTTEPGGSGCDIAAVYAQSRGRIEALALGLTRDQDAAQDVLQESFLRLIVEARAGRMPSKAESWLTTVAMNIVRSDARRRVVAKRRAYRIQVDDVESSAEQIADRAEQTRAAVTALSTLGPVQRRALVLAATGVPGIEIARRIGRSPNATRTMMHRARNEVRRHLELVGS